MSARAARRRHRGLRWTVGVIVVLAVLCVGGEFAARAAVAAVVRHEAIRTLDLPEDQQIDVTVPGLVLPQLVTGHLGEVDVSSKDVTVQGINAAVSVRATDVPLSTSRPIGDTTARVTFTAAQVRALLRGIDPAFAPLDVSLAKPGLKVSLAVGPGIFGTGLTVGAFVNVGVSQGDLTLAPTALSLSGLSVTVNALRSQLGDAALAPLTADRTVCVRSALPRAVTLKSVTIEKTTAVVDLAIDGRIVTEPGLRQKGSCG